MSDDILRPSDVVILHDIISAGQHNGHVIRLIDGRRVEGTVRGLREHADGTGNAINADVRDLYVHVTPLSGPSQLYWPVREVMQAIRDSECIVRIPSTGTLIDSGAR